MRSITTPRWRHALTCFALFALSACGGGGSGEHGVVFIDDPVTVSGTAASARPLSGASVTLKDASGQSATTTTDANGRYAAALPKSFAWPVVARVSGGTLGCGTRSGCTPSANTQSYVGVAAGTPGLSKTLNLTPMSHAIVSAATRTDADALFATPSSLSLLNPLDLIDATFTVLDWLLRLDPLVLIPRDMNFLSGDFSTTPLDPQDLVLETFQQVLAALLLDQGAFDLLVTTSPTATTAPPAPLFCDVAGHYQGSIAGSRDGTWAADVDASTGVVTNASLDGAAGLGALTRTGLGEQRASVTLAFTTLTQFQGNVDAGAVMSGSWSDPLGASGSFVGQRISVAATCH
ncbi:MAG: carboxypeptidase-like regulatory domain-containing protein [Burkholderiales bacterium]